MEEAVNDNILIVGAGFGQVPAILKAKEMGLTVIAIDKNPNAVGMKIADHSFAIDIIDFDGALEIAKRFNVKGVMTMQTDLPIPTIGYINDNLKLNGVSYKTAQWCSNKMETRKRLKIKNCSQPDFRFVKDFNQAKIACELIGYPCVIKCADSSGSRGVTKVNSEREIKNALNESFKFTRKDKIIVEEYINGLEFGAQTFSVNGKCVLVLLHSDILSQPPHMIPVGHSFPFEKLIDEQKEFAINEVKLAVEALCIYNGPANIDLILDEKSNKIKIIEVGARIGATCLPELVEYHSGIDWVKQSINSCLGIKVNLNQSRKQAVTASIIQSPKDGELKYFSIPESVKNHKDLKEIEINVKLGESVNILRKGTDRIGKIIVTADRVNDAEQTALDLLRKLTIEVV